MLAIKEIVLLLLKFLLFKFSFNNFIFFLKFFFLFKTGLKVLCGEIFLIEQKLQSLCCNMYKIYSFRQIHPKSAKALKIKGNNLKDTLVYRI